MIQTQERTLIKPSVLPSFELSSNSLADLFFRNNRHYASSTGIQKCFSLSSSYNKLSGCAFRGNQKISETRRIVKRLFFIRSSDNTFYNNDELKYTLTFKEYFHSDNVKDKGMSNVVHCIINSHHYSPIAAIPVH